MRERKDEGGGTRERGEEGEEGRGRGVQGEVRERDRGQVDR